MIVTTASKPSETSLAKARALAEELSGRFLLRRGRTLSQLIDDNKENRLLVVLENEVRFYEGATSGQPLYYHPSMAFVRVKRLLRGEPDPLIELSGCAPGDSVVDCTAGMCADSLVFSVAVGAEGTITALESEPVLYAVIREGLQSYKSGLPDADDAMRRITMRLANHTEYLSQLPDKSVDIVYFDPMFQEAIEESSAIGPLRALANYNPLSSEAVEQAKRVARKCVMLKEQKDCAEFERLGFTRCKTKKTSKITYGVIRVDAGQ
ncbi:class I SAM-dependent methyltransferase [Paenibacillus sp. MMS18-CY102]|uniref:class I SAM-dependent methyltransferase n=1 Tax=Paenibacillus sp. MMS18-CY102 TaxID=2682849 RepID=UPI0013654F6D|nr:class I SAM-dependent methyltransferase [Paenibacillus sp. MMS18-CY102]MWC28164.1 SAM-dependent methyltransferase [Paenibacillus sp. MMS18-CY102]